MEILRDFDYRPPAGPLKLLGALMVVLAPITVMNSMEEFEEMCGLLRQHVGAAAVATA